MIKTATHNRVITDHALPKSPTGIQGLDEVTGGGLPRGRPTLLCGGPGCGKTLLAMEFLVRGATQFGEPGVFLAFEESAEELAQNVHSLGFDLQALTEQKKLKVSTIRIERSEIEETGDYDLEGLFIRLGSAIDSLGAKRVVLDTIETIFSGLTNVAILRAELRRLFRWLKDKKVTAVITAERGVSSLTQYGLEEYVSDCVIVLDHRVTEQISTRRLRIVKYRGSAHGTNEFPFLIDKTGVSVVPITSMGLDHDVSTERVSSGIPGLDAMLGVKGFYRGSSVLISGTAGTGKTTVANYFASATCQRGERVLYFAFEESCSQLVRNMRSVGLDLAPWIEQGLLRYHAARPTLNGLEMHLATIYQHVNEYNPQAIVVDPISDLTVAGSLSEVKSMLSRLVDFFKSRQITAVFTNLTNGGGHAEATQVGISSVIDTWVLLQDIAMDGERNRGISILKSRGMEHSNQVREFCFTSKGVELIDVYSGPDGILTGSARIAQEANDATSAIDRRQAAERHRFTLERRSQRRSARIAALQAELQADQEEIDRLRKLHKIPSPSSNEAEGGRS